MSGKRALKRQTIEQAILSLGREHLAHHGAAALSLRAIARDLGMVSSGIYRYVDSRDELLTRLIIGAYTSVALHVTTRHDEVDVHDLEKRWDTIGLALREWALEHPHDYALIYGSPVPGYNAPAERTTGPGTAVPRLLVRLLDDARAADRILTEPLTSDWSELARLAVGPWLDQDFFVDVHLAPGDLTRGLAAYTLVIGTVTSEVFGQLGELPGAEALFRCHLAVGRSLFLTKG